MMRLHTTDGKLAHHARYLTSAAKYGRLSGQQMAEADRRITRETHTRFFPGSVPAYVLSRGRRSRPLTDSGRGRVFSYPGRA